MTHEEILTLLGDYVDYLIANSSAEAPMWYLLSLMIAWILLDLILKMCIRDRG